jgi:translation initiation factor IF-2
MAADTENTLKPKAELIKRKEIAGLENSAVPESGNKPPEPERKKFVQDRKKAVKKPVVKPTGSEAAVTVEKPARKVKVLINRAHPKAASPHPNTEEAKQTRIDSAVSTPVDTAEPAGSIAAGAPEIETKNVVSQPAAAVVQPPAAERHDQADAADKKDSNTKEAAAPAPGSHVSVYKETARPAVQVGRVGGKFIGPKPRNFNYGGANNRGSYNREGAPNNDGNKTEGRKPATYVGRGGNAQRGGYGAQPSGGRGPGGANQNNHSGGGRYPNPNGGRYQNSGGAQRGAYGGHPFRPAGQGTGGYGTAPRTGAGRPPGYGTAPRTGMARPAPIPPSSDNKNAVKRTFKTKKPDYQRRDKEVEMEKKHLQAKKRLTQTANPVPKSIDIMEVISVSELARKMNLKASDLIAKLMKLGQMVSINQQIDSETAAILASEFGADVKIVSLYDETLIETEVDDVNSMTPRSPVVTVMGHVDHGKTKLLDAIRSADVVSGEFGGITQHIGAYMVETPHGGITFLDTPGHEAFTRMRSRGAQVTDVVVLVVAADDGVMPQTIEAINHAKEADVPIIVAINKIDKPDANPDKVRSQLSELGLQPEEWGGQTMFIELSALKKEGLDKLIEAILLQAEILDLRVNYNRSAEGKILESRIDHGRGIVATVLVERGVLEIGDSFVAGIWPGKVRAIFNDKGKRVDRAVPSMPVEVLGFEGIPNAGDPLQVVEDEKIARSFSAKRQELKRFEDAKNIRKITLDNLYDTISDGEIQELKVIIKGDVQGSVEALRASLEKLSTKEVRLVVIQSLPGAINEGDVDLASASNAILIGFNVRPTPKAKSLADQEKVDIRRYNIIYRVVEDMQKAMEGLLKPDTKEEVTADVEVREVFKISKLGVIAGCYVRSGTVKRSASINVIRNDTVIHTGKIASLRRFKDDVKEVAANFECGISLEGFNDIKVGDEFEVFEIVEVIRKL